MKKLFLLLLTFSCFFTPNIAWCWNYSYHFVIAQIAVDQLTIPEKNKLENILAQNHHFSQKNNYLYAAIYPDLIKKQFKEWNSWHYINLPYSPDGTSTKPAQFPNVVSQLKKITTELQQKEIKATEKAILLSLLIHFTGDIHQPMHCINLYSKRFPSGDRGGNLYLLPIIKTPNLHRLWDDGLELRQTFFGNSNISFNRIKQLAAYLEKKYPKPFFQKQLELSLPTDWANESYIIARNFSYQTPFNSYPSKEYFMQNRIIVEKQLALAGYRLAIELKEALNNNVTNSSKKN